MKNTIALLSAALLLTACGNTETNRKAPTDLVNNPATIDAPPAAVDTITNAPTDSTTAKPKQDGAAIKFEKLVHDFGTITQGEQVEYNFVFTNTGNKDLIIANAHAACGCTVPEYSKQPIKPGEQGKIKVKFNSDFRTDAFEKAVTVTANTQPLETMIFVTGYVNPKPNTGTTKK
jgi:hypothetical protein